MCVEGNAMLYAYCEEKGIAHRRLGKLVVAATDEDVRRWKATCKMRRPMALRICNGWMLHKFATWSLIFARSQVFIPLLPESLIAMP